MNNALYKNTIRRGLVAVMVFAPLVLGGNRLLPVTVIELSVLVLVFIWFWHWKFKKTPLDLPILGFALLAVLSVVFGIYLHAGLVSLMWMFTVIAVYYLTVNNFSEKAAGRLIFVVIITGACLSLYGFAQQFFMLPRSWWAHDDFISSTYVNHNHFAGYLEMSIPLALGMLHARKDLLSRIALAVCLAVMIAAFIFAQSRGGWISLTAAVLFITYGLSRSKVIGKYAFYAIGLLLALSVTVIYSGEDSISERLGTMTDVKGDASIMSRVKMWQGTAMIAKDNPLTGTGMGTLEWGYPRYRPAGFYSKVDYAHNDYLQMAAEMGVLVLPIMAWMLFIILKKGCLLLRRPMYAGIMTGLVSIIIHGFADFNFHIPANMLLAVVLCAILMSGEQEINI
jgi:O-antigen ligase